MKTDVIPVPIMFVYNEAKLTPEGERAASLLLEYLNLKHFSVVELTGHADERGTDGYNYDLSRERLRDRVPAPEGRRVQRRSDTHPQRARASHTGASTARHIPAKRSSSSTAALELRVTR